MMKSVLSAHILPAVAFGLLFATLGLTFAFATSDEGGSASRGGGSPRAFGSACVRPPVTIVTGGDLGLVLTGTEFFRQIIAINGFRPHKFTFTSKPTSNTTLSTTGVYFGIQTIAFDAFQVAATDNSGTAREQVAIKNFILAGEDPAVSPVPLHFLTGAVLPVAVASSQYVVGIQVNGGVPPYTVQAATDADVEAVPQGLNFRSSDPATPFGTETLLLFGKPLSPTNGAATFTLTASDSAGSKVSRTFSLTVLQGTISSDFVASAGTFTLAFGKGKQNDKLNLTMLLNKTDLATAGIRRSSDLNNVPFSLVVGGNPSTPQNFNNKGTIKVPNIFAPQPKGSPALTASLNPTTGLLKVSFSNVGLIAPLNADSRFFRTTIPFRVLLGQAASAATITGTSSSTGTSTSISYDKTDVIEFSYHRTPTTGKGNASKNQKLAPAGIFFLSKVRGTEIREGAADVMTLTLTGDIRQPGGKPIVANPTDIVQILLGDGANGCIGNFPASSFLQRGDTLNFNNTDTNFALKSVAIDNKKGTFVITTNPFAVRDVFGVDILTADIPNVLTLTLTIAGSDGKTTTFDGQTSAAVFRKGTKLINK